MSDNEKPKPQEANRLPTSPQNTPPLAPTQVLHAIVTHVPTSAPSPKSFGSEIMQLLRDNWVVITAFCTLAATSAAFIFTLHNRVFQLESQSSVAKDRTDLQKQSVELSLKDVQDKVADLKRKVNETHAQNFASIEARLALTEQTQVMFRATLALKTDEWERAKTTLSKDLADGLASRLTFDQFSNHASPLIAAVKIDNSSALGLLDNRVKATERELSTRATENAKLTERIGNQEKEFHDFQQFSVNPAEFLRTLNELGKNPRMASDALRGVSEIRSAVLVILETEASRGINSIMMNDPTELHFEKIRDLKSMAMACKHLFSSNQPSVITLIENVESIVDPKVNTTAAGKAARDSLAQIKQENSTRCYALARVLLARFHTPERIDEASDFVLHTRHAMETARQARTALPSSAAAWNIELNNQMVLAELELLQKGHPEEFLTSLVQPLRDLVKVQDYDETLVGRYKYLNNTAYWEAIALGTIVADSQSGKRVSPEQFKRAFGMEVEDLVREARDFTDSLIKMPLNRRPALRTSAEVFAVFGALLGTNGVNGVRRRAVCDVLSIKADASAGDAIFKQSFDLFCDSLAGRSPTEQSVELDRFGKNRFFSLWPANLKKRGVQTINEKLSPGTK